MDLKIIWKRVKKFYRPKDLHGKVGGTDISETGSRRHS